LTFYFSNSDFLLLKFSIYQVTIYSIAFFHEDKRAKQC